MEGLLQELISHFYQLIGMPIRWMQEDQAIVTWGYKPYAEAYDQDVRHQLWNSDAVICYQITPEALAYGFIRLKRPTVSGYLMLGPVLMDHDRHQHVIWLAEAFHATVSDALWEYVNGLAVFRSEDFISSINTMFAALRRHDLVDEGWLHHEFSTHIKTEEPFVTLPTMEQLIDNNLDEEILSLIRSGNVEDLKKLLIIRDERNRIYIPDFEGVSALRTFQDIFIASTVLCMYTAIFIGVDRALARAWTNRYITIAERMRSIPEIERSTHEMMIFFAEQIAKIRRFDGKSEMVQKVVSFITGHFHEKISVQQIAEAMNTNASYLSHEFKRQTGISISDMITREKVEEAKKMLRRRRSSILEISQQLGFSSQQYFQNVFKKHTGMTPARYQRETKI